jgi:hypothetical protein
MERTDCSGSKNWPHLSIEHAALMIYDALSERDLELYLALDSKGHLDAKNKKEREGCAGDIATFLCLKFFSKSVLERNEYYDGRFMNTFPASKAVN